jgi:hypothetical protein
MSFNDVLKTTEANLVDLAVIIKLLVDLFIKAQRV